MNISKQYGCLGAGKKDNKVGCFDNDGRCNKMPCNFYLKGDWL